MRCSTDGAALATGNPVLLADEPTGELDFRTGSQILELLYAQAAEERAVLVVTHNRGMRLFRLPSPGRVGDLAVSSSESLPEPLPGGALATARYARAARGGYYVAQSSGHG